MALETHALVTTEHLIKTTTRTVEGGHVTERVNEVRHDDADEMNTIECSCGAVFDTFSEGNAHISKHDDNIDLEAYMTVLESLIPDDWFCDWDDSILFTHPDYEMQLRIHVEQVTDGEAQTASLNLWSMEGDATAGTDEVPWAEVVSALMGVTRLVDSGQLAFAALANTLGDVANANRYSGNEVARR